MWIMLITKLPTRPSPSKMSIHWAVPWPNKKLAEKQFKRVSPKYKFKKSRKKSRFVQGGPELEYSPISKTYFCQMWKGLQEPYWAGARKIHFGDVDIRVFPHEFSILTPENMHSYVSGSHEFVAGNAAGDKLMYDVTDGDLRLIHDAALLDGCNERQAVQMALGIDVSDEHLYPEPLGWYRITKEYGAHFCHERELIDHE